MYTVVEHLNNEPKDNINDSLDLEEAWDNHSARQRNEMFKSILLNNSTNFSWQELFLYTLGSTSIGVIAATPYSLIPVHDLIQYSEYWYEIVIQASYSNFWASASNCLLCGYFTNIQYLCLDRILFLMSIIGFLRTFSFLTSIYLIWTLICGFNFPVPFMGYSTYFFNNITNLIVIWYFIPKVMRHNGETKTKVKNYLLLLCWTFLIASSYEVVVVVLRKCPPQYQPIFALALPALREVNIWIAIKYAKKSARFDLCGATIALKYCFSTAYTFSVCNTIGTIATETTSWILIALDFFFNIYLAFRLVWLRKRHPDKLQAQIDVLQDLGIYELVEILASASFLFGLGLTYFGPNGNLYGNIRRSIWTFTAIEDINKTMISIGKFFAVDFSSTIICAIILRVFCQINLLNVFLQLQKEFRKYFLISLSRFMIAVSINRC